MAKNNFSLDFNGFLDLAEDISSISNDLLLTAAKNALEKSAFSANIEIGKAMKNSKYNFQKGQAYSQGKARKSLIEVSQKPVEVVGTVVTAYAGVNLKDAPEVLMLAKGTPHLAKDKQLANAIFVKGGFKKRIMEIQKGEFNKVIEEALRNG